MMHFKISEQFVLKNKYPSQHCTLIPAKLCISFQCE